MITPPPTFTIVIAAFNAEPTIGATLTSVLRQTRADFEAVVVDDGSTDETAPIVAKVAEQDARIRLVQQANAGLPAARNAGIAAARGTLVSFLDADDLYLPRYLEAMGDAFGSSPGAGLGYTDAWVYYDELGRFLRQPMMEPVTPPSPPHHDPSAFLRELLRTNFVYGSTTVPRRVLEEVGGYRTSVAAEDYELSLRIVARGYSAVRAPGTLAVYRIHSRQMSADRMRLALGRREALRSIAAEHELPADAREILEERIVECDAIIERERAAVRRSRLRSLLSRCKQRLLRDRTFLRQPPEDVREALGDLL